MKFNNLKLLLLCIILVFIIPNIYSLTLQELINSYNFGYNDDTLNITLFTDYMVDSNSNGANDTLIVNLTINSTKTDFFEVFIDLSEESGTLSNTINRSISSGISNVNLSFNSNLFTKHKYNYSVRVYNASNILVFSEYNIETNTYNRFENGTNINRIMDENIGNNHIRINLTLNVTQDEDTNITVYFNFNNTIISAVKQVSLTSGLQTVSIDFDNETIKSIHYNGNLTLDSVLIGRKLIRPNYATSVYNYEDFAKTSYFRNYSSSGVDANANNLSEFLEINFTLVVKNANTYEIQSEIYDQFNNFVKNLSKSGSLSVGNQTVNVRLNGSDIYATKISGHYVLSFTKLIEDGNVIDKEFEPHTILNLTYTDFERPPLPDLKVIMNVSFNQTTNATNITVEIINIGESPAFNIFLDTFNNETFSITNNTVMLDINQSQNYTFIVSNTSNATLFTAIADFDNLVDESDESNNIVQNTPAQVVSLAIDSITTLHTDGTLKTFEFVILNDGDAAVTNIQWHFDTNDSYIINSTSNISSLAANEKALVYVQYNFSAEGTYNVKANATGLRESTAISASLSSSVSIRDLIIESFDDLNIQGTNVIFEIQAKNNLNENISSINWSVNTNNNDIINSTQQFTLESNKTIFIYANYDYGAGGAFNPSATVTNITYSDTKSASVTTSSAPAITSIPDIGFNEDAYNASLNLSNYASDAEDADADLTWTASNNANVIVIINQTTKIANFTALANWSGSENIKLIVNDTSGLTDNDTILVTVNPINDQPTFNSSNPIANLKWPEDIINNSINLTKHFYDIDGDNLNYTSAGTANITVYINNNTGIVNLTPNANFSGINYIIFTAKDSAGLTASSNNITLNLTPVNDKPVFSGTIPQWKWPEDIVNNSLNLTQYFSDIDGDVLKYNFTRVNNITISINNNTGIVALTPDGNFTGIRYAVFTAVDIENLTVSSNNATLNVTPVNDVPVINSFTPSELIQTIVLGNSLTFNHTSGDIDGDALTYIWKLDLAQKSTELGWTYTPAENELGSHNVTLNVSDGIVNITMQWNITLINQSDIKVYDLTLLNQNSTASVFGFNINNTGSFNMSGINWSLNTGQETISASSLISLEPNESIFVFASYNYTTTGEYIVTASATNKTNMDSETFLIDIPDIEVSNLTVLNESGNKRIFEIIIENTLLINLTNVNWTFDTNNGFVINATNNVILQPSEQLFIYLDYNFTATGTFNLNATARNGTLTDSRNLTVTIT